MFNPKSEIALSVIAYSFCSGSLVLVNKLSVTFYPYPSLVATLQIWSSVFIIYGMSFLGLIYVDPIKKEYVKPYLFYTVAFAVGIFCNMKSLSLSNVETIIVARALAPLIVTFLDSAFLGRELPSPRSWTALALIAAGAYGYAATDDQFRNQGLNAYVWPILYLFVTSFQMAYGKKILQDVNLKTVSGPVQYTNLLGWPPMLLFAGMGSESEYTRFARHWSEDGIMTIFASSVGVFWLIMGCLVGTAIGYTGWWCRDKVSATSYTMIGIMNKCFTVLVNCLIWDQHAGPLGIASLFLCLVGGALYRQSPMRGKTAYSKVAQSDFEMSKGSKTGDEEDGWRDTKTKK